MKKRKLKLILIHMNIIIYPFKICPECCSDNLKRDIQKEETYCSECGLIVKDSSLTTIKQKKYFQKREKEVLNELKQYPQLKRIINYHEAITNSVGASGK